MTLGFFGDDIGKEFGFIFFVVLPHRNVFVSQRTTFRNDIDTVYAEGGRVYYQSW